MGNVEVHKKSNLSWFPLSSIVLKNVLNKYTDKFLNTSDTEIHALPFKFV